MEKSNEALPQTSTENLIAANFVETNRRLDDVYNELKGIADALADMNDKLSVPSPYKNEIQ